MTDIEDDSESFTIPLTESGEPERRSPCGNYGDIDGDGIVSVGDGTYAMQHAIFGAALYPLTPAQKIRADVDGDGKVSEADAQLIADYVEGNIDTFPVCGGYVEPTKTPWILIGTALIGLYEVLKRR